MLYFLTTSQLSHGPLILCNKQHWSSQIITVVSHKGLMLTLDYLIYFSLRDHSTAGGSAMDCEICSLYFQH